MTILLFTSRINGPARRLNRVLEERLPEHRKTVHLTLEDLVRRIRNRHGEHLLGIILASSPQDMSDLMLVRDVLKDLRFILIVPDRDDKTLSRAHALRPRYISYLDGTFDDVAAVTEKMIGLLPDAATSGGREGQGTE